MKDILRKIFFSESVIREYVSVAINDEIREHVYLGIKNYLLDISLSHWILCLDPVVFGIWIEKEKGIFALDPEENCIIYFKDSADNKKQKPHVIARMELRFLDKIEDEKGILFLFTQIKTGIHHVSFIKTLLLFFGYYKKAGLSFNKFKSIVAAFSYPRRIRLISFGRGEDYNIFPMDFAGEIVSSNKFIFGLRHTNQSLLKIIETGKIVVSEIPFEYKAIIYQLGKHHLSSLPSPGSLPFKIFQSASFGFYIPDWANSYTEIKIVKSINLGSHMLLWGESVNKKEIKPSSGHLFHIHFLLYLRQKKNGFNYFPADD